MPRSSHTPSQPNHRNNGEKHRGTGSHRENVRSGYHASLDEIEYLRAGGKTIPERPDLISMSTPGTFRTYGHNGEQDGDADFDSSYGDDQKAFNNLAAGNRFLHGKDEASAYNALQDGGAGRFLQIKKEPVRPVEGLKKDRPKK